MDSKQRRSGWVWIASFLLPLYGLGTLWGVSGQLTQRSESWPRIVGGLVLGLGSIAVVAAIWWPRRPPLLDPNARVVVRAEWWLRLGGFFAAVMGAGLWSVPLGLTPGATGPDSRQVDGVPGVILTVALLTIATICLIAGWGVWWIRESVSPDEATSRVLLGSSRIEHSRATAIKVGQHTVHAGRAGGKIPVARVFVEGPNQRGEPARVGFDPTLTKFSQACAVLGGWVQRRPELVADDERARALFTPDEHQPTES